MKHGLIQVNKLVGLGLLIGGSTYSPDVGYGYPPAQVMLTRLTRPFEILSSHASHCCILIICYKRVLCPGCQILKYLFETCNTWTRLEA